MPDGDHHLAEERRLFYVGMTRAREALHLSWARDYGTRTARRPSPYLLEALDLPPATPVDVLRPSVAERLARNQRAETPPVAPARPPALGDRQLRLSYGQISDYLDCPARYRYAHVIRLPTPASHQMAYGRALHAAVQAYHRRQHGRPDHHPRGAAGGAGRGVGVGRLPHPSARGGPSHCGARGARPLLGRSSRSTPLVRWRWRRSSR